MVKPVDEPRFNFSRVSRRWAKRFSRVQIEMAQRALIIGADARPDLTPAEQQTLNQGRIEAADRIFQLEDERDALLCEVLEYVPADWLVEGAPDSLDWHDVESLDWVQAGKFDELLQMVGAARQASAKN